MPVNRPSARWLPALTFLAAAAVHADDGDYLFHIQCTGCHRFGQHAYGPDLCGVEGRHAGSAQGYEYTRAMRDSGIVWSREQLVRFLESPMTVVPGTRMGIFGFEERSTRERIAAYVMQRSRAAECRLPVPGQPASP